MRKPLALIIMDGFGISEDQERNAINDKTAPCLKEFFKKYPMTLLKASGEAVGLPEGQMGNSEVGHMSIGAGRIIYQGLSKINKSIEDKSFYKNEELKKAILLAKENNKSLHLMGLLSDGGVHSHIEHLFALLKMAKNFDVKKVFVHVFLDGRDTDPESGEDFVKRCQEEIKKLKTGKIATIVGRYYAMDRDNRWDRTKKAYDAIVEGLGSYVENPVEAVKKSYVRGVTDEFIEPIICEKNASINSGDSVIFFNFRPDRARQITHAIVDKDFDKFTRQKKIENLNFVCMTQYDKNIFDVKIAFKNEKIEDTLPQIISKNNLKQLKIAETEKYAHVTFFFNGGIQEVYKGEDRVLINSPKVKTYDLKPEMSAFKITKFVKEKINMQKYDIIILNFANCDMVGHTGVFEAAKIAVKTVDTCVKEIVNEIIKFNGSVVITADHGNVEKMADEKGNPFTAHTTNLVPCCVIGYECMLKKYGTLADVAPTILEILNIKKPTNMTGKSLIIK